MSGVTKNGDLTIWQIAIGNDGPNTDTNMIVTDTLPAGLAYVSATPSKGTFDKNTGIWTVGTLNVGQTATLKLVYKVMDITQAIEDTPDNPGTFGFRNTAVVSGDNVDPEGDNNTSVRFVELTTCAPEGGAVADDPACVCGDVSKNDTECSHGISEWRLTAASHVNLDPSFDINIDGTFNAYGKIINPTIPATFKYSLWCVVGMDEYEVSGPVTVTIPPILSASDSLVDNGDGTATHTAIDGTAVIIPLGWTTASGDAPSQTLTFTYPDGSTVDIDISGWFVVYPERSVYSGTVNSNLNFTVGTLKEFTKVDDSGAAAIQIGFPDPGTLGLSANTTYVWTFKRVNNHDGGSITIVPDAGLIEGAVSYVFPNTDNTSVEVWTDGTDLWIR